ncbi:MAG: hypothetical protein M1812_005744 [Candelaria pacifica]|nr:MAG: hypothetical protein M1812_005744 [Candelaria pacifica]
MAASMPRPRSPAQYAGVVSSGERAVFNGNTIAGRDIIIIQSTAKLARSLYGSCVRSHGTFNQLASYISTMVAALDDAKRSTEEATSGDHHHGRLVTIITGCNDVLLAMQALSQEYNKHSEEAGHAWEGMEARTEELAALKVELNSHIGALNTFNTSRNKITLEKIEDALQRLVIQTRAKSRQGSIYSVQMHRDEEANALRVTKEPVEATPGQGLDDEDNLAAREGSILSSVESLTADEKRNWRQLRKELEGVGITPAIFAQRQALITTKIRELIEGGALEEEETIITQPKEGYLSPTKPVKVKRMQAYVLLNALGYRRQDKLLLAAISAGSLFEVEGCLKKGARVSLDADRRVYMDKKEEHPLCLAATLGNKAIVRLLLDYDADIEVKAFGTSNPLLEAARCGHKDIVQLLLDRGADVNFKYQTVTPLRLAASSSHWDVVKLLLERGATDDDTLTTVHQAIREGHNDLVQLLLERGADTEVKDDIGRTPLHLAASRGRRDIVQLLLEHGADIEVKDDIEWTPLHEAADRGYREIVQLLLEHEADIEVKKNLGRTPLHLAASRGHRSIVQLLLECGANIKATDNFRWTSLHLAADRGYREIVQLLLEHGANIEATDIDGRTPLISAAESYYSEVICYNSDIGVVQVLLEHGANIEAKDKDGKKAIDHAKGRNHKAVERLLLEHEGANRRRQEQAGL